MATVGQVVVWNNTGETEVTEYPSTGIAVTESGVLAPMPIAVIDVARNLVDDNSVQAVFPAAGDALTVVAGMLYRFRGTYVVTKGVNNVTLRGAFGGTATFTMISYIPIGRLQTVGTPTNGSMNHIVTATAGATTSLGVTGTGTTGAVIIDGLVEINAGGTFIPSVAWSGATGSTPTIELGTYFEMWAVGMNPVTAVGPWA